VTNEPIATATGSAGTPDPDELRTELEEARAKFHALLRSVSAADWRRRDADTGWTASELLLHLALSLEYTPRFVDSARSGKPWSPLPSRLLVFLNGLAPKLLARGASPEKLARKYDAAHAATLAVLRAVQPDDWHRTAFLIDGRLTVEEILRLPRHHVDEHAIQLRRALASA
jgi:hypothetical protein